MDIDAKLELLREGELKVTGRLVDASNATLFATSSNQDGEMLCIYKPVAGERPLWDFADGCLANREYAAYLVSRELGFNIVPLTTLREGPYGVGMAQEWITIDDTIDLATFFSSDHPRLRAMALFDAIINNTDRKIGHLLPVDDQQVLGCDHGVTFHVEDKLRTVLWQWAQEPFNAYEMGMLRVALNQIDAGLKDLLEPLLTHSEIAATKDRIQRLLDDGAFPLPSPDWPAVPWPAF